MEKINRKAYIFGPKNEILCNFGKTVEIGTKYHLTFDDKNLEIIDVTKDNKRVILLGLFVDCRNADLGNSEIAGNVLKAWKNDLNDLFSEISYLAGHFIAIAKENEDIYFFPDACSTYNIAYMRHDDDYIVSSNPKILADMFNLEEDFYSIKMRDGTNVGESLPNDCTMYAEIKTVLPNHVLNLTAKCTQRLFPLNKDERNVEEICTTSAEYFKNITTALLNKKQFSLPLTSGIDSRTILSAIGEENASKVVYYTYFHKSFTENSGDIAIPKSITSDFGLKYLAIPDEKAPEEWIRYYENEIESNPEIFTPGLCYTYNNSELKGKYFLSGGIAPVGKSVYGHVLPEFLCTPLFLLAKTHNSSKEAYKEIKKWYKNIKPFCKKAGLSVYDMFYWEYRCGRWDQRTHLLIDASIDMVSPYNCGKLLSMWVSVDRKYRQKKVIHKKIIEKLWPKLLEYPLNPDDGLFNILKKYRYVYWILSYVYWVKESITRYLKKR